jgi:YesN/AraC family two-component response regulator
MITSEMVHTEINIPESNEEFEKSDDESSEKPVLLIVEDNKDVVEYLETILKKTYKVELASNGKIGIEKARKTIPDIILSDVMMPQMDGFEMLEMLKTDIRTDHIPVVILTARGDFDSKLIGLEFGADHYLVKPFNEKELLLKLNNLLELRRKMQKHFGGIPFQLQHENTQYKPETVFIKKINALIEAEMGNEDFGVKNICILMNMSRAQLYRKFSAITNNSIGRYLRSYRLYKAKSLLEKQGKNVTEVAFETGFKNLSHFSTCFHEEFGYAPNKLIQ